MHVSTVTPLGIKLLDDDTLGNAHAWRFDRCRAWNDRNFTGHGFAQGYTQDIP